MTDEEFKLYLILLGFKTRFIGIDAWKVRRKNIYICYFVNIKKYGIRIPDVFPYYKTDDVNKLIPIIEKYYD